VGRADPEVQPDLAQGRRVAAVADRLGDELEDLALPVREDAARIVANQSQRAHVSLRRSFAVVMAVVVVVKILPPRPLLNMRSVRNRCAVCQLFLLAPFVGSFGPPRPSKSCMGSPETDQPYVRGTRASVVHP